ncbi:hypothetical protein BJ138DRAFT_1106474 [Hygrophoropsis aurantiaca]|uniref:Uncharacterized protein n=1 Tax=Hygrophoropsis aurantiaca TaxID=72124 RepID=A0ACB7ZW09_9AGAM|nr:hypothetical protein BJ138DRAFT_1106474 [Hygrophoropsis aurantiaca]
MPSDHDGRMGIRNILRKLELLTLPKSVPETRSPEVDFSCLALSVDVLLIWIHSLQVRVVKEWTDSSATFVVSFGQPGGGNVFQSPHFDKCGVEWQFSLQKCGKGSKTFLLSSQWRCKDNLERAVVDVVARWEPSDGSDSFPKSARITFGPNLFAFEFGTCDSTFLRGKTLSLSAIILEPSLEPSSMTLPHPRIVSTNSSDSEAASTASAIIPEVFASGALMKLSTVLQILAQSLESGAFFDAKFITCSRRRTSNRQGATRMVYAQTEVLKAVSPVLTLDEMFVREDELFLRAGITSQGGRAVEIVEEYDYKSDSDLDESEGKDNGVIEATEAGPFQPSEAIFKAVVEEQDSRSTLSENAASVFGERTQISDDSISAAAISDFEGKHLLQVAKLSSLFVPKKL